MPAFPEEVILEYITKYITEDYNLSPDGNWININSTHTHDTRYRMGFNIPNNYVHDFKLDEAWPLEEFVAENQNIPRVKAHELLMQIMMKYLRKGIQLKAPKRKVIPAIDLDDLENRPEMKSLATKDALRNKVGRTAIRYLIHRGFELKHIQKFNLMYCDQWDCYQCGGSGEDEEGDQCPICKGRGINPYYGWLMIPSYENGNLVYFQGRNLDKDSDFRYRNPKNVAKSQVVFFYDQLKENSRIFITEGPMDAMTLYDESVCAIMGNRISDPQAQKILRKNPTEIIFIPDWDPTAEKRQIISKAIKKNIDTFKKHLVDPVKIGIYAWYKKYSDKGKDLNEIGHTHVEEDLIIIKDFKSEVREKFTNS